MQTNYLKLIENLKDLKFKISENNFFDFLKTIDKKNQSFIDNLLELTEIEKIERQISKDNINIKVASFPFFKTIDDFDFNYQPSINEPHIRNLLLGTYIENKENIIFYGNSGVGKTHLATSLGIAATKSGHSTYFIKASKLFSNLKVAREQNRLEERLKHYCKYQVLIIDELGYLPINEEDSKLFFQLIDKRYEKKSTIITSNIPFSSWNKIFQDSRVTMAIIDRILHHCNIININGRSYRLKDILDEEN